MTKSTVTIKGMTCEHCVGTVTKVLNNLEGVSAVSVTLKENNAQLEYDEERVSLLEITKTIEGEGYQVKAT